MSGDLEARVREALRVAEVTGMSGNGTRRIVERALSSEALSPQSEAKPSAGNLPPDEPNYKALYTELKGEVLEKVGPLIREARLLHQNAVGCAINHYGEGCEQQGLPGWLADSQAIIDTAFRALSSLHEELSSIGGSSSAETAASLADGKLTAGEAQRESEVMLADHPDTITPGERLRLEGGGWKDAAKALTESLADERDRTILLSKLLIHARAYVADALEAHEHSDGRTLLTAIDDAFSGQENFPPCANCGRDTVRRGPWGFVDCIACNPPPGRD